MASQQRNSKKVVAEAVEPQKVSITIIVHTTSGTEFEIPVNEGEAENILQYNRLMEATLVSDRIRQSDDLAISALDKSTYHFHIPNIECVRVKVD